MDWLFYAILAPAVYAVVVFIDKYIIEKEVSDYRGMPIYSAVIASICGTLIWFITGLPILSIRDASLIILTGMLTVWGLAFYFRALSDDEVSKVTFLFQITPIITLILSYLFLSEKLSSMQLLGFLLILVSTIAISLEKKLGKFKLSNVFFLILVTDFLWASAFVLFKFVVDANSFSNVISYESWGIGLGGLLLYIFFPSIRQAFISTNKKVGVRLLWFIAINEGVFLISRFLTYLAISKGSVALVDVVAGTQVIFAIILGFILTMIAPRVFQETISKNDLLKKITMAIFVLIGLWLIRTY